LEAEKLAKEENRQRMADLAAQAPKTSAVQPAQPGEQPINNQPPQSQQAQANKAIDDDLAKWKRKALKALDKGNPACVPFESEIIPLRLGEKISLALKTSTTPEQVENAFIIGDMLPDLATELQRANSLLERAMK
jgi:hypothetical protein